MMTGGRLRKPMRSPGRPGVAKREDRGRFWQAIASGRTSEDAGRAAGVAPVVGSRWFREAGGMPPSHLAPWAQPPSGRYLSFAEREEIALLRAQGHGVREIARRIERAPSTVSRELRRNAATRGGGLEYRATTAQWHAERAGRRPRPTKLERNVELLRYVEDRLAGVIARPDGEQECQDVCVSGRPARSPSDRSQPWMGLKRSSNMMANWLTAVSHPLTVRAVFSWPRIAR